MIELGGRMCVVERCQRDLDISTSAAAAGNPLANNRRVKCFSGHCGQGVSVIDLTAFSMQITLSELDVYVPSYSSRTPSITTFTKLLSK